MITARPASLLVHRVLRQVVGPMLGACVVGYFAYHAVQGDRGLVQLTRLQKEVAEAETVLAEVRGEREAMERRAHLLRPDNLDPDMIEERARQLLNFSHPDELVILLPGKPAPLSGNSTPVETR